jgi:hypothetical protein
MIVLELHIIKFCGLCMEELSKTRTAVSRDIWRPDLNSNRASPEYECTALPLSQPARYYDCVYDDVGAILCL